MDNNLTNLSLHKKLNDSFKQKVLNFFKDVKLTVVVLLLFCPVTFYGIKNLIFPPKPKCIKNQVALITGGGKGLGRSLAFRFAKEKCKLAIVDIDFKAAQQTAAEVKSRFGVKVIAFRADVSKHEDIVQLKKDVEVSLGNVDILLNNAALLGLNISLREDTHEAIQKIVDINLSSHFWALRTFLDGMIVRKHGHVIAISSLAGKLTAPCSIAYCATKFGVTGFMEALYDELCFFDQNFIKTTTVFPTFINTQKELCEKLDQSGVTSRLEPDDAAEMIVNGILADKRKIYLPASSKPKVWLNSLPDRIIQYVKAFYTKDAFKSFKMRDNIV